MLFPTTVFALFFCAVFWISWSLDDRQHLRKYVLLAASYAFYGYWDWRFLSLLIFSSALNYVFGHALTLPRFAERRRLIVGVAVTCNLIILGFFKYFGFFVDSLAPILQPIGFGRDMVLFEVILPIGISFFTFQGISYVVDVYRGTVKPVRTPVDLFLYISFFPQLVAGPIVRAADFLPQLNGRPHLTTQAVSFGLLLILVGLFKKVVISSYLATEIVDDVFAVPESYSSLDLFFAAHAFVVQIYCDFSGYSDIAIGVAALLGYQFKKNFDRPLAASTLQDLWQRWHISLTSWLRDYLYKPLKGKKRGTAHMYRNLLITMTVAGLWHGAAWTFVIWGALQGAMLVAERWLINFTRRAQNAIVAGEPVGLGGVALSLLGRFVSSVPLLPWFLTLNAFALTAILFRAEDMQIASAFYQGLIAFTFEVEAFTPFVALLVFGSIAVQFLPSGWFARQVRAFERLPAAPAAAMFALGLIAVEFVGPDGVAPFIYFQF
jgi:alginate O-acetyltransferase complex protein AlgI